MFAKQLTPKSWVLSNAKTNKSLGMVNLRDDKYFLMGVKESFESLEDIASKHFKTTLKDQEDTSKEVRPLVTDINGYPVKHPEACEFETKYIGDIAIETYKLKPGSKKIYAAGWIGLKFKNGLGCGIGVLFDTLKVDGFIGPYKNEIDLQFAAKQYNNGNNNDSI